MAAVIGGVAIFMNSSYDGPVPPTPDVDPDEYRLCIAGPNGILYADFAETEAAKQLIGILSDSPRDVTLEDYGNFEKVCLR